MSYKTDRLVALFPDAYAANEWGSLLYRLLDAAGAELMEADDRIKRLLKSHWVRYAEGSALDGLGAIFAVARRTLRNGELEQDEAFRRRLQATVPLFTGGGTVEAILGAVRSALGLPFSLDQLRLPAEFAELRKGIEELITLTEFSPQSVRVLESAISQVANASELILEVTDATVRESLPQIIWSFDRGAGRLLSLERMDTNTGVKSKPEFLVPEGSTLVFSDDRGRFSAVLDGLDVSEKFVNLDDSAPPALPPVPNIASRWKFRAKSGVYDVSRFDSDAFDLPQFQVALSRTVFQPLTFDVQAPYFLKKAVEQLKQRHKYQGELFIFEGIPLERIQEVVDQTRAAGVRGSVQFSLTFLEDHSQRDQDFRLEAERRTTEDAGALDSLLVANVSQQVESQTMTEQLTIAGVFDISPFDGPFGFL
jgi:hypothetical protein